MVSNRNSLTEMIDSPAFNIYFLMNMGGVRGILFQKTKFRAEKVYI